MSGTVLVIDDDTVNLDLLQIVLEKAGHAVVLGNTGQEALELLAERPFDLVMMDIQMPGMDGMTATKYIRQCEHGIITGPAEYRALLKRLGKRLKGSYTPIIAVTAHAMSADRERCFEAGMDDYLTKPFRPEVMFAVLERVRRPLGAPFSQGSFSSAAQQHPHGKEVNVKDAVRENLQRLYHLNPEKIEAVLAEEIAMLQREVANGNEAISLGDLQLLGNSIYRMKRTLLGMGLGSLADLAQEIEDRQFLVGDPVMADKYRRLCQAIAPLLDESM